MTAPTFPDDADELAAIATTIRPIVDAGKGRALALEIVKVMLWTFGASADGPTGEGWFSRAVRVLYLWYLRALDIDTGRENERHPAERLTLLHIAGVADRIASQAWCLARTGQPIPLERWIVFDLATALRRACECSADSEALSARVEADRIRDELGTYAAAYVERNTAAHEHTAAVLLPLLIRDLRRLCTSAQVDPAPIEAAIARFGGTPS